MKLLFIFTGGTIGSTLTGSVISPDKRKPYSIINAYSEKYGISFEYDVSKPYTELSENNTGIQIKMLGRAVTDALKKDYDGIIVTHGTDTLQYSAAAVAYATGSDTPPVCFVSANAPIEDPDSNGLCNLHGAIRFIEQRGGRGVFVVYRNSVNEAVTVHRATRLLESRAFSHEVFSIKNSIYGYLNENFDFVKSPDFHEDPDRLPPLSLEKLKAVNESTLVLSARPAMRYPMLPHGVKYVIVNTYHSGTLDTRSEAARSFFSDAKKSGVSVFATGVSGGRQYVSATLFEELGIQPIRNISPVAAYVKLWLGDSMGISPREIFEKSLSGDLIE